jgi:UDP-N-acetylglucosamine 1-carboxyvinyltransferase
MGANLTPRGNVVELEAKKLHGARIHLPYASVGATENIMMAATLAEGTTYIQNAAQEPEVVDLANLLTQMGAKVKGAGTSVIRIDGVENLRGVRYSVIPDRIVAGTFLIAGAITGGEVTITGCIPEHVESLTSRLTQFGAEVAVSGSSVTVNASRPLTGNIDVQTAPYPGFPTDLQAPLMALLTVVDGVSTVTETVFDGRFRHVGEFCRLGAEIKVVDRTAVVRGVNRLTGTNVKATDLRAGAALVLAGLAAQGVTVVENTTHVDRGYEKLEQHLSRIGAFIRRIGA